MKWILLVVIVLLVLLALALWRRVQASPGAASDPHPAVPQASAAPPLASRTPAAEESVDEATGAPASEQPAHDLSAPDRTQRPPDWWTDEKP